MKVTWNLPNSEAWILSWFRDEGNGYIGDNLPMCRIESQGRDLSSPRRVWVMPASGQLQSRSWCLALNCLRNSRSMQAKLPPSTTFWSTSIALQIPFLLASPSFCDCFKKGRNILASIGLTPLVASDLPFDDCNSVASFCRRRGAVQDV